MQCEVMPIVEEQFYKYTCVQYRILSQQYIGLLVFVRSATVFIFPICIAVYVSRPSSLRFPPGADAC